MYKLKEEDDSIKATSVENKPLRKKDLDDMDDK